MFDCRDDWVAFPGLEAVVDDVDGGADAAEDDEEPEDLRGPVGAVRPEEGAVDGRGRGERFEEF